MVSSNTYNVTHTAMIKKVKTFPGRVRFSAFRKKLRTGKIQRQKSHIGKTNEIRRLLTHHGIIKIYSCYNYAI